MRAACDRDSPACASSRGKKTLHPQYGHPDKQHQAKTAKNHIGNCRVLGCTWPTVLALQPSASYQLELMFQQHVLLHVSAYSLDTKMATRFWPDHANAETAQGSSEGLQDSGSAMRWLYLPLYVPFRMNPQRSLNCQGQDCVQESPWNQSCIF